jgi:hypothetical protein
MSHEVNNTVASSTSLLQSSLTYARELGDESRRDFETALGVVIARTAQLNDFMKGFADVYRLPPSPPCELVAIRARRRAASARPEAAAIEWRWSWTRRLSASPIRPSSNRPSQRQKNAVEATAGRAQSIRAT